MKTIAREVKKMWLWKLIFHILMGFYMMSAFNKQMKFIRENIPFTPQESMEIAVTTFFILTGVFVFLALGARTIRKRFYDK